MSIRATVPRGRSGRLVRLCAACLLVAAFGAMSTVSGHAADSPEASQSGVPVTVTAAKRQDVPVTLSGIGTVQAFSAVTVRARVDGTLMKFIPTEGQEVKQNDLIAVIDPRPYQAALDGAMAKKAQDEAQLANAKHDLTRYASLAKQDFASHQQVDTQQTTVDQFTATIQGDQAAIEAAQLNLSFAYITSPIDGRVGLRQVDPGNLIHPTDPTGIVTITQIHPISVVFTLPQTVLPQIVRAMAARTLPVAAVADDGKSVLDTGVLLTPDNAIDANTGTIKLKATFPNKAGTLWPGQFVEARLLVDTRRNVLTVPSPAVQHGPDGLYVYIVKPDQTIGRQNVAVAQDDGHVAVVSEGLDEGATVVVSGQARLQAGTLVAARNTQDDGTQDGGAPSADPAKPPGG